MSLKCKKIKKIRPHPVLTDGMSHRIWRETYLEFIYEGV